MSSDLYDLIELPDIEFSCDEEEEKIYPSSMIRDDILRNKYVSLDNLEYMCEYEDYIGEYEDECKINRVNNTEDIWNVKITYDCYFCNIKFINPAFFERHVLTEGHKINVMFNHNNNYNSDTNIDIDKNNICNKTNETNKLNYEHDRKVIPNFQGSIDQYLTYLNARK